MARWTCTEAGSNKFWEAEVSGSTLIVRFGKVGTKGQTKERAFADPDAAAKELAKIIREKEARGYVRADAEREPSPGTTSPAAGDSGDEGEGGYFALHPRDWDEGANDGHAYEIRFRTEPDAATKIKIAGLFEKRASKGVLSASTRPWLWSGPWALLYVGERPPEEDEDFTSHDTFIAMSDMLTAIGKVATIRQAVFLGARDRGGDDDGRPSDGPEWPGLAANDELFGRKRFKPPAKPAPDPAFEDARAAARGKAPARPAKLEHAYLGKGFAPPPWPLGEQLARAFPTPVWTKYADARCAVVVAKIEEHLRLYVVPAEGAAVEVPLAGDVLWNGIGVDASGAEALVLSASAGGNPGQVARVELPSGTIVETFRPKTVHETQTLEAVAAIEGGFALVAGMNLLAYQFGKNEPVCTKKADGMAIFGAHGGRVLLTGAAGYGRAFLVTRGKLTDAGKVPGGISEVREQEGRAIFCAAQGHWYELKG